MGARANKRKPSKGQRVDEEWQDGQLASATVRSLSGIPGRLRYGKVTRAIAIQTGETLVWDGRP
jgi:hypothetical protein